MILKRHLYTPDRYETHSPDIPARDEKHSLSMGQDESKEAIPMDLRSNSRTWWKQFVDIK
jgi:hypothetical protein